jgi:hypothetical protein
LASKKKTIAKATPEQAKEAVEHSTELMDILGENTPKPLKKPQYGVVNVPGGTPGTYEYEKKKKKDDPAGYA